MPSAECRMTGIRHLKLDTRHLARIEFMDPMRVQEQVEAFDEPRALSPLRLAARAPLSPAITTFCCICNKRLQFRIQGHTAFAGTRWQVDILIHVPACGWPTPRRVCARETAGLF